MVKVIVLGHGLIPRGKGIAPCKEPFEVDKKTIKLMLQQGGLIVKIYNPNKDKFERCTFSNYEMLYDAYDGVIKKVAPKPAKGLQVSESDIIEKEKKVEVNPEEVSKAINSAFSVQDTTIDTAAPKTESTVSHVADISHNETTEIKVDKVENNPSSESTSSNNEVASETAAESKSNNYEGKKNKYDKRDKKNNNSNNNVFKPINADD